MDTICKCPRNIHGTLGIHACTKPKLQMCCHLVIYNRPQTYNEKNTQTVINGLNLDVKYRTQPNSEMSSSLLLFTSQLDDYVEDDGSKPGSTAMDCAGTSGGLSLSFRDESMRMELLLGSICQPSPNHPCRPSGMKYRQLLHAWLWQLSAPLMEPSTSASLSMG